MSESQKTRRFIQHLNPLPAAKMRQSASLAVRRRSVCLEPISRGHVMPPDFESEYQEQSRRIELDLCRGMLLFPEEELLLREDPRDLRTEYSTVPEHAMMEAGSLFTKQCIRLYSQNWAVVGRTEECYCGVSPPFMALEAGQAQETGRGVVTDTDTLVTTGARRSVSSVGELPPLYEVDIVEAEQQQQKDSEVTPRDSALTRSGYLLQLNIASTGKLIGVNRTLQSAKKRWHTLKMNSEGTGFQIESSKPGRVPGAGGKSFVSLVHCISVRKSIKGPPYSFELITRDNKVSHCFVADSNEEMIEWINAIASVLSSEMEMESGGASRFSIYTANTLKRGAQMGANSQQRTSILTNRLMKVGDASADNAKERRRNRKKIFWLHENLARRKESRETPDLVYLQEAAAPATTPGFQFVATPERLNFDLRISSATSRTHIEPFFTSAALYDARYGKKISEEFHFDLNGEERELFDVFLSANELGQFSMDLEGAATRVRPINPGFETWPAEARRALFTVSYPHPEVYMVVRIDKVLQGAMNSCAEPYIRGEGRKNILKLADQLKTVIPRLGNYKQPFAWSAKPVFQPNGDLDTEGHFPLIFRQEKERISEEEIIKLLKDFRNIPRFRIQVIPGSLCIALSHPTPEEPGIFTTGLVPLIPMMPTYNQAPFIREVQEFPTHSDVQLAPTKLQPFQEFVHHLYVYPHSLKLDGAKLNSKAKNLSVRIQFLDSDGKSAHPLPLIFGRPPGSVFVDKVFTSVIHHHANPDFAEEAKIYLPIHLHSKHHLLFTFYHISCNIQKISKKSAPDTIGYAWLPILKPHTDCLLNKDSFSLPISTNLPPGYLSHGLGGKGGDLKWIENMKPLFRVHLRPVSSIFPQDTCLHNFFSFLEKVDRTNGSVDEQQVQQQVKDMHNIGLEGLISHLPLILNQLLKLFTLQTLSNNEIGTSLLSLLVSYAHTLDQHGCLQHLATFVRYQFLGEGYPESRKEIYAELIRYMVYYMQQEGVDFSHFLKYSWFLFGCVSRSIAYYIISKKSLKSSRKDRFGQGFTTHLLNLLDSLIELIRSKPDKSIGLIANQSLAVFVRDAFSYMDRGDVFILIHKYLSKFPSPGDLSHLTKLKFHFLQMAFSHEHYVQLNLPVGEEIAGGDCLKLGEEFCRAHYPVGVLLREFYITLKYEKLEIRTVAIHFLRDVLAKHDADPRYCDDSFKRSRVACLYMGFLSMVLQFAHRVISGYDPGTQVPQIEFSKSMSAESSLLTPAHRPAKGKKLSFSSPRATLPLRSDAARNTVFSYQSLRSDSRLSEITERPMSTGSSTYVEGGRRESESSIQMRKKVSTMSQSSSFLGQSEDESIEFGRQNSSMELGIGQADFSLEEKQLLLACFLNLLKNSDSGQLVKWWDEYFSTLSSLPTQSWEDEDQYPLDMWALLSFFDLLVECLYTFSYSGKRAIYQETLPLVTGSGRDKGKTNTVITTVSADGSTASEDSHAMLVQKLAKARSEFSHEVSLIVISVLDVFASHYRSLLETNTPMMKQYFKVIITFFDLQHSDVIWVHWYAYLFSFIYNFPSLLFRGQNEFCEFLIYNSLAHCNSRLTLVRNEACTLLYFLLRSNFEFSGENFVRTQLYATISISKLSAVGLIKQSDAFLKRSLNAINTYSGSEASVKKHIQFQDEVQELMRRLKDILSSLAEMRNVQHDYDELVEVYWMLAASYSNTPELRITWLDNLGSMHMREGFLTEAAQCYLHIAAILAQYLYNFGLGKLHSNDFESISHNIPKDEGRMKIDQELRGNQSYTEKDFILMLEKCLRFLYESELYEHMLPVFKLTLPLLEENRDFEGMERLFRRMHESTLKTKEVMKTGRRFLGTYFRCKFFGKAFGSNHNKQYIYREPGITTLAEFVDKMTQKCVSARVTDLVILKDSSTLEPKTVDASKNYMQITHVEAYFQREKKGERQTKFERENKMSHFFFQTPFTKSGRSQGSVETQYMQITILRTRNDFPYIKRRIEVIDSETIEQTPIEVAITALRNKTSDLEKVIRTEPPDLNLLELTLQGCVGATVNEGPLEYYRAFLSPQNVRKQAVNHVQTLKDAFSYFVQASFNALEMVSRILGDSRQDYQEQLSTNFHEMVDTLEPILQSSTVNDRRQTRDSNEYYPGRPDHSFMGDRTSFHSHLIFSAISGSALH